MSEKVVLQEYNCNHIIDTSKALLFIPGLFTEFDTPEKHMKISFSIMQSGWDGEILHLKWQSGSRDRILRDFIRMNTTIIENAVLLSSGIITLPSGLISRLISTWRTISARAEKIGQHDLHKYIDKQLRGKRITFVAHSLGVKMLHSFQKHHSDWITGTNAILLGGAVNKNKIWNLEKFASLYNVYNEEDKILKLYKYAANIAIEGKFATPCGLSKIPDAVNIDSTYAAGGVDGHGEYTRVFENGSLVWNNEQWKYVKPIII